MNRIFLSCLAAAVALAGCGKPHEIQPPSRSLTTEVEKSPWQTPFGQGMIYSTDHYRIFSTATRHALMAALPGFLEASYDYYTQLTGLQGPLQGGPLRVYLLATRPQWAHLTAQLVRENLKVYLSIDAGGYCYKGTCVFWDVGGLETLRLAAHEGLHQFLGRHNTRLPTWLEEGLCVMTEGLDIQGSDVIFQPERNFSRFTNLRDALVHHQWIPVEQLVSMDDSDAVQDARPGAAVEYYAQLWALALYLQSRPETQAAVKRIVADSAAGKLSLELTPDDRAAILKDRTGRLAGKIFARQVFRKYVSADFETFDKNYQAFARKLARLYGV